jgi:hypothetical protein
VVEGELARPETPGPHQQNGSAKGTAEVFDQRNIFMGSFFLEITMLGDLHLSGTFLFFVS